MLCTLCPRKCLAIRDEKTGLGFCKMPQTIAVAKAYLHKWEEPCISGENGSGTIFFSGCSLGCVFCQNEEISHKNFGKLISVERLAEIFYELEKSGAHNINLVNPTHYISEIKRAVDIYRPKIPILYNSGGYDTTEAIALAAEFCDIFLMDMKYSDSIRALKYSKAHDYPAVCKNAILKCAEVIKENIFDSNGLMKKGLIIRHLILPQGTNDALSVIDWIEQNVPWAVFSLMSQYTPFGDLENYKEINRRITKREYQKVLDAASMSNIKKIYTQELSSSNECYIPMFDLSGV